MNTQYDYCRHKPKVTLMYLLQTVASKDMTGKCSKCGCLIEPTHPRKTKFAISFIGGVLSVFFSEIISIVFANWKYVYKLLLLVMGILLLFYCSITVVFLLSKWERSYRDNTEA